MRTVNFEGKQIPANQLPPSALLIKGVWYANEQALPAELQKNYAGFFAGKDTVTPLPPISPQLSQDIDSKKKTKH